MKKLICLLLAVLLLAAWAGACVAEVNASYNGVYVTVTTDEKGFWEIFINGKWTGYYVDKTHRVASVPFKLEDGDHEVMLYNSDTEQRLYYTLEVVKGKSANAPATPVPTATPVPKGPVKLNSVSYAAGAIRYQVSGLRGYAEIWLDGEDTGFIVTENGENSLACLLPEGEHTLALYVPAYNEKAGAAFRADTFRPDAASLRDALQGLIRGQSGEELGGGYAIDRDGTGYLLRVTVDGKADAVLTVEKDQLQALLAQGLTAVEYACGDSVLRVDLTQLAKARFATGAAVSAYSFAVKTEGAGVQVSVSGLTDGSETVEAERLIGVSLIRDSKRTFLTRSGVY